MFTDAQLAPGIMVRPVRLTDASALATAYQRNREHLAEWDPAHPDAFYSESGQRQIINHQLSEQGQGRLEPLVIEAEGRAAGRVTLSNIVRGSLLSGDLGYWIDAELTGRGLMTAAVRLMLRHAFSEQGLHRVAASTLPHNAASRAVLGHCGFERIGLAPQYLKIAGRWQDHLLFQRLGAVR